MGLLESLEERLIRAAESLRAIELLVLFGSTARATETGESDVDLGVILVPDSPDARRDVEVALGRAAARIVDVVDLATAPPLLRFEIARDGKVLYEGRRHAWADFGAHAMLDWWDWAPTARMIHAAAAQRIRTQVHGPP